MLRHGQLHIRESAPQADGTFRAITLVNVPGHGVLAWAGYLLPEAAEKSDDAILLTDYRERITASFSAWSIVWAYFENMPDFALFVPELRARVEALIARGKNAPGSFS